MKTTPLLALAPLALLANACTTTQSVNDTIRTTVDLTVENVDVSCTDDVSEIVDEETMERISGSVDADVPFDGETYCVVFGYYRGPVLNFDELRNDLPEGVEEVTWSSVDVTIDELAVDVDNITELPTGGFFGLGLAATSEDRLLDFELLEPNDLGENGFVGRDMLGQVRLGTPGSLLLVESEAALATPLPLDQLAQQVIDESAMPGDATAVADVFNQAFANGAQDLYVLGGAYFATIQDTLPETPSDVTLTLDLSIGYEADARVDLLGAARGAANN